jgi:hypothetical protein
MKRMKEKKRKRSLETTVCCSLNDVDEDNQAKVLFLCQMMTSF